MPPRSQPEMEDLRHEAAVHALAHSAPPAYRGYCAYRSRWCSARSRSSESPPRARADRPAHPPRRAVPRPKINPPSKSPEPPGSGNPTKIVPRLTGAPRRGLQPLPAELLVLPWDLSSGNAREWPLRCARSGPVRSTSTCRPDACRSSSHARNRSGAHRRSPEHRSMP